jgi:hypothetical protein
LARPSIFATTLALLFVFASQPARAQVPDWRKFPEIDINVDGVELGMAYPDVVRQLGAPEKERVEIIQPDDGCRPGTKMVTLLYHGLQIHLRGDDVSDSRVWSVNVASNGWSAAPGFRVGESHQDVRWLLGEPGFEFAHAERRTMVYATKGKTGIVQLDFHGAGRLYLIELTAPCAERARPGRIT